MRQSKCKEAKTTRQPPKRISLSRGMLKKMTNINRILIGGDNKSIGKESSIFAYDLKDLYKCDRYLAMDVFNLGRMYDSVIQPDPANRKETTDLILKTLESASEKCKDCLDRHPFLARRLRPLKITLENEKEKVEITKKLIEIPGFNVGESKKWNDVINSGAKGQNFERYKNYVQNSAGFGTGSALKSYDKDGKGFQHMQSSRLINILNLDELQDVDKAVNLFKNLHAINAFEGLPKEQKTEEAKKQAIDAESRGREDLVNMVYAPLKELLSSLGTNIIYDCWLPSLPKEIKNRIVKISNAMIELTNLEKFDIGGRSESSEKQKQVYKMVFLLGQIKLVLESEESFQNSLNMAEGVDKEKVQMKSNANLMMNLLDDVHSDFVDDVKNAGVGIPEKGKYNSKLTKEQKSWIEQWRSGEMVTVKDKK